jgi:hypothetical protein
VPLPLGFRTVLVPQLPASPSNSSLRLNSSIPLTHSLHSTNSQDGGHLTLTSSRLSRNRSCSSLYSLGTDRIENSTRNSSSIVASRRYRTGRIENTDSQLLHCCVLRIWCLAKGVFAESFPNNGCIRWFYCSCLEEICHNIEKNTK